MRSMIRLTLHFAGMIRERSLNLILRKRVSAVSKDAPRGPSVPPSFETYASVLLRMRPAINEASN